MNNCEEIKFTRDSKDIIEVSYNNVLAQKKEKGINEIPTMYEVLFEVTNVLIDKYSKSDKVYEYQLERKSWEKTGNILKCIEIYYEKNNIYDLSLKSS